MMNSRHYKDCHYARGSIVTCASLALLAFIFCLRAESQTPTASAGDGSNQPQLFSTAREAADALIKAATSTDRSALERLLGPDGQDLLASADPVRDKANLEAFAAKASEKHTLKADRNNLNKEILLVGSDDWPLPIPIVKRQGQWSFDAKAGRDEVLRRRIGANELDAIAVCRGYVDAQREYAAELHDGSSVNQYAQKIMSSPGKRDGLYWINADGTPDGPIGEEVARALEEGYTTSGTGLYHGYYFRILKGQGPDVPLGQIDYVIQGVMIGGFALVAVPAQYRVTGVQTFMVNQDGIVFQKDLGPDSLETVRKMTVYNPDKSWRRTQDAWPTMALSP